MAIRCGGRKPVRSHSQIAQIPHFSLWLCSSNMAARKDTFALDTQGSVAQSWFAALDGLILSPKLRLTGRLAGSVNRSNPLCT
ncbi:MAG: hypothetical protein E5X75_02705 [Mesorhizobium sp.]|nr:MAG: hypothetical protein E5X75_02705 [Mesorhizobium sp.]